MVCFCDADHQLHDKNGLRPQLVCGRSAPNGIGVTSCLIVYNQILGRSHAGVYCTAG